jgi:hypothetical protein
MSSSIIWWEVHSTVDAQHMNKYSEAVHGLHECNNMQVVGIEVKRLNLDSYSSLLITPPLFSASTALKVYHWVTSPVGSQSFSSACNPCPLGAFTPTLAASSQILSRQVLLERNTIRCKIKDISASPVYGIRRNTCKQRTPRESYRVKERTSCS